MLTSIIIPTCNRNDLLSKCLDLLYVEVENMDRSTYEVIVTDDNKNNMAKSLIQDNYPWVSWIEGPKKGPATNRNNGAEKAKGEWLIFLDDDCLPQKNWIASYFTVMQLNQDLVLEGSTNADRPQQRFDEEAPINLDGNKLWSCNFAIRKSFFIQLGGFDESFPFAAMEDVDFYTRVLSQTHIKFIPQALVIHPWRQIKSFKSFEKHLKSQKHFAKKYGLLGKTDYRWSRTKIFVGGIFIDLKKLLSFSMKGWIFYLEKCVLNFCMIFI